MEMKQRLQWERWAQVGTFSFPWKCEKVTTNKECWGQGAALKALLKLPFHEY